jgi:hypothetical protein
MEHKGVHHLDGPIGQIREVNKELSEEKLLLTREQIEQFKKFSDDLNAAADALEKDRDAYRMLLHKCLGYLAYDAKRGNHKAVTLIRDILQGIGFDIDVEAYGEGFRAKSDETHNTSTSS